MLTLLLPASPARNEPLQPDEKALEDTAFSHFLARQESPQFAAVRGLMQQATTLGAFRRLAADPEAMRSAEALRARATTEPQMLSVLSDQARRIRADPQLMATMSAMQRVLADRARPCRRLPATGCQCRRWTSPSSSRPTRAVRAYTSLQHGYPPTPICENACARFSSSRGSASGFWRCRTTSSRSPQFGVAYCGPWGIDRSGVPEFTRGF